MNLKQLVKSIVPYGIVINRRKRIEASKPSFINGYLSYLKNKSVLDISDNNINAIVSIQGLGYSGSGAVVDFLREFDSCCVFGGINDESKVKPRSYSFEVDIARLSGGLFEIEKYLDCHNTFFNDALLNRFILCAQSSHLFQSNEIVQHLYYDFFHEITELIIPNVEGIPYNSYLHQGEITSSIFFLKNLSLVEYRKLCSDFISRIINAISSDSYKYVVLDQFFSDIEFDFDKYEQYSKNTKSIVVIRDPRDVYAYAIEKNVSWIAHKDYQDFVKWFKIMTRRLDLNDTRCLILRFEELVLNYDATTAKIMNYLNLTDKEHIDRRQFFEPNISKKNIGIWKSMPEYNYDFGFIYENLKEFCIEANN